MGAHIEDLIQQWLDLDRNDVTRQEIQTLWDDQNLSELQKRLGTRIEFGTAGLRGRMEAGSQVCSGLCAYVLQVVQEAKPRGVVIGHDHRHNSERWARLTASVFVREGVQAYLLGLRYCIYSCSVPFSVSTLGAACGYDNGYKVYWENAVQIIGPHDEGIAAAIQDNLVPRDWDMSILDRSPLCINNVEEMRRGYFTSLHHLSSSSLTNHACPIKFVNTSMHGVSHGFVAQAFEIYNFPPFVSVPKQRDPDPDFPTVKFPNPEEKEADECAASYVLAQDPDSDRFSCAEKLPNGQWKVFSGDQIGTLLAAWTLDCFKRSGERVVAMVASTVSSKMIGSMARAEGFRFVESLTGFKYIGNVALQLEKSSHTVIFGYEEAIGFMLGSKIRDKDGVAATMCFAEMVAHLHPKPASAYLDELYEKYGYFQTSNSYFICSDPSTVDRIFAHLRKYNVEANNGPAVYPKQIAGLPITRVRDLTVGHAYDSINWPSFQPDMPLSGGHMTTFWAKAEGKDEDLGITLTIRRVSIYSHIYLYLIIHLSRTSGTEPKIKYYLEGSGSDRDSVALLVSAVIEELGRDWMEVEKNRLLLP
ncbi:hypothetical protein BS47DRAFT_1370534 [Hydnum rufescens UP504]|uniref:Phosphoglucomutase n=1 Tax=Hydnum rufescens UP504 TaxID=1448309 RepID=A0A9P6E2B5_9AGAM|nr:hypothetical protein BS47DRAFT_1370534 [Hydnum rufescens UP504]